MRVFIRVIEKALLVECISSKNLCGLKTRHIHNKTDELFRNFVTFCYIAQDFTSQTPVAITASRTNSLIYGRQCYTEQYANTLVSVNERNR